MDRITRFARPHCYDASQGPLSFLDSGRRSRSTPRMNVDPITRKARPERLDSDSGSSPGFANSRLRAQSSDSLTWRRTAKVRQQHLAPRQHMSHGELRTDSTERLANTVVINFSNSQIGEPNVFAPSSPVVHNHPTQRTVVNNSTCSLLTPHPGARAPSCSSTSTSASFPASSSARPPDQSSPSFNKDHQQQPDVFDEPELRPRRAATVACVAKTDSTDSESKVRPVVETVAVRGRRLSYSRAAGADRLDSSDLDDLARQIGLLDNSCEAEPKLVMAKRTAAQAVAPPEPPPAVNSSDISSAATASTKEASREGRSRKGKMGGWLGGLFRRLRHKPDHSGSSASSSPPSEDSKKHRRRARSLPPTSKRSASSTSQPSGPPSCNSPSTAGDSPTRKKTSMDNADSEQMKKSIGEKPVLGVSRSRTVDDIERARAFGSCESTNLVLPQQEASRVEDTITSPSSVKSPAAVAPETRPPPASTAHGSPAKVNENGAPDKRRPEKPCQDTVNLSRGSPARIEVKKGDIAPKYCNLAVLAYGYRPPHLSEEQLTSKSALEDRTNVSNTERPSSSSTPLVDKSSRVINNSKPSDQSSESVENSHPTVETTVCTNGHHSNISNGSKGNKRENVVKGAVSFARTDAKVEEVSNLESETKDKSATEITPAPVTSREDSDQTSELVEEDGERKKEKNDDDAFETPPVVPDLSSMPRVRINVEPCEPGATQAAAKEKEEAGVVFRRKKTVSCSETTDSLPRSSLIMLAVSQASPRPKTEFSSAASDMSKSFKNCPMSVSQHEDMEPSGPEERDGFYYLRMAAQVEAKFRERMTVFEEALESQTGMSEEAAGFMRSVLGKANLLLTDKFAQLRGLCQQNISEQVDSARQNTAIREGGFATRNSDLDGYWALVQLPVEDLEAQFRQLDNMRENGWRLPEVANGNAASRKNTPVKRRPGAGGPRKKKTPPSGAAKDATASSAAGGAKATPQAQARIEARKRLEAAKREAAAKMRAAAAANPSSGATDTDVFIFV